MKNIQGLPEQQRVAMGCYLRNLPIDYRVRGVCCFEDTGRLGVMTVLNSEDKFLQDEIYHARAETLCAHHVPFTVYVVYANRLDPVRKLPLPGFHVVLER